MYMAANERNEMDFFFEIIPLPEPEMGATHLVIQTEWRVAPPDETWPVETLVPGDEIDRWTTDDPYGAVEAARECQAISLEERWAADYEAGR